MSDPYPFESEDEDEIGELDLEDLDLFREERVTVGELASEHESWRFGHVIVDEAQDLTPMQWRMVMRRVRGRSLTIVGDLAQRSTGEAGTWSTHLPGELADIKRLDLTINYRSPSEIHELAVQVLREFAPGVVPSYAIRSAGCAPEMRQIDDREAAIAAAVGELHSQVRGQIAVIEAGSGSPAEAGERVQRFAAKDTKGLEFDAVVLVEPTEILAEPGGPALLYISLTRATQRLVVLHTGHLPEALHPPSERCLTPVRSLVTTRTVPGGRAVWL